MLRLLLQVEAEVNILLHTSHLICIMEKIKIFLFVFTVEAKVGGGADGLKSNFEAGSAGNVAKQSEGAFEGHDHSSGKK